MIELLKPLFLEMVNAPIVLWAVLFGSALRVLMTLTKKDNEAGDPASVLDYILNNTLGFLVAGFHVIEVVIILGLYATIYTLTGYRMGAIDALLLYIIVTIPLYIALARSQK